MGDYRDVYVCSGDATKWVSVQPLSLYTACRGWAVPFQKPQGQPGVGAGLSETYLLRQYRDSHSKTSEFCSSGGMRMGSAHQLYGDIPEQNPVFLRATYLLSLWTITARAALGPGVSSASLDEGGMSLLGGPCGPLLALLSLRTLGTLSLVVPPDIRLGLWFYCHTAAVSVLPQSKTQVRYGHFCSIPDWPSSDCLF